MTELPTISAIIPSNRAGDSVRRAVRSVLKQDYTGMIETLVVLDGTEPMAAAQPERSNRVVRVLKNERDPGPAGARNTGIASASGEIVGFLDDDDIWLPNKISTQVTALGDRCDVAVSGVTYVAKGRYRNFIPALGPHPTQSIIEDGVFLPLPTLLVRKQILLGVGLFDEAFRVGEDTDLWIRLAGAGRFVLIPRPLVLVSRGDRGRLSLEYEWFRAGFERLSYKHREVFSTFPKGAARRYSRLAGLALLTGRRQEARRWAMRALMNNPINIRDLLVVLGSMLLQSDVLAEVVHRYQAVAWRRLPRSGMKAQGLEVGTEASPGKGE